MLASGQMGMDLKNAYIRQNKAKKIYGASDKSPPENPQPETVRIPNHSPPQPTPDYPEETFKHVKNQLKLNQSAMLPDNQSSTAGKQGIATQKLDDLADKSDSILLKVSTFWPFTFFVNDIIVDPYKVNIIFREFFWSEHIHSVMIKDILDVVVETSVFFATVKIVDQGYVENTIDITYLKRDDAMKVRKIIQGLVIAHRQAVDLSILTPSHIRTKAEELGQVKGIDDTKENQDNI